MFVYNGVKSLRISAYTGNMIQKYHILKTPYSYVMVLDRSEYHNRLETDTING